MVRLCMKIIGLALSGALLAAPLTTQASDITVIVDGQSVIFEDVQPTIIDARTMVPLRGVFDMMGFSIDWDSNISTATLSSYGTTITVRSGDSFITVNGVLHTSDVAPRIQDGRFMLPLSLIAESTGAEVSWDQNTRTVSIITATRAPEVKPVQLELAEPLRFNPILEDISLSLAEVQKTR
ncbi:MAG: copper amine oxidase N-terminal domain-containing protein, partial [Defluviitaleaceae bacterium]|nr:copper amine oxidase N-terminal domain-containing protein [Defluviitaleaceae bacterium]